MPPPHPLSPLHPTPTPPLDPVPDACGAFWACPREDAAREALSEVARRRQNKNKMTVTPLSLPSLSQSVFHVAHLRGLFPDKCFKSVEMANLDGEWRVWRERGTRA